MSHGVLKLKFVHASRERNSNFNVYVCEWGMIQLQCCFYRRLVHLKTLDITDIWFKNERNIIV